MFRRLAHRARGAVGALAGRSPDKVVPYGMFDVRQTREQAAQAQRLERIYHKGQERIWDGREVLQELVEKHGGVNLPPDKARAVRNLFAVILWGELAAWKISAELALRLEPLGAKLAATAQAHDEARHFYVMHDYLDLLGYQPGELPPTASRTLEEILKADTLVKKLMGMQLMVEPIALTLFQLARERRLEPVLCELLPYYERDEARHVALGVNHLPELMRGMGPIEAVDLWLWQLKMFELEIQGQKELAESFRCLGIEPREVLKLGMGKQVLAFRMMMKELGQELYGVDVMKRWFDFRVEFAHPDKDVSPDAMSRFLHAARVALRGLEDEASTLTTVPET